MQGPIWKRLALVVAALVVVLAVLGAVLAFGVDSDSLGRAALSRAGERLGLELAAERFDFHLLRGLEIEGLTARGRLSAGDLDGRIERVVLRHELWPLLSRRLVIDELLIDRPRFELIAAEPAPASPAAAEPAALDGGDPAEASSGLQLRIDRVRLRGGELILGSADPAVAATEVHGLDLALDDVETVPGAPPGLAALRASGELAVASALLGEMETTDGRGAVALEDGHLRLLGGHLTLDAGEVHSLELDLDLTAEPFRYELALGAEPLRTERLLFAEEPTGAENGGPPARAEAAETPAGTLGPSRLQLEAKGQGGGIEGMQARGSLAVDGGRLPASPIFVAIDALVDGAGLVGADYQPVDVEFRVARGRVDLQPFQLVAGGLTLDVRGTAVPDGPWDLWLALAVPRQGIDVKEVPRELLDVLTDETGRLHLPLRVSGTAERVRVVPDPDALAEASRRGAEQRARQKLEQGLSRGLRKLFGGKDDRDDKGDGGGKI